MSMIPQHIIDEIMNTARIEEVIMEYVQLKKAGANYKALSPFSEERTPSFMVSPAKQIFKDFSSGKGGTVVSFLMEIEQFSYPEALRWLAEKYNIQIPESAPSTLEEVQKKTERESLQIINDFARDFFVDKLQNSNEGKTIGYSYFIERDFKKETIDKFQLGYCPKDEKSFTETAIEKSYKQSYLELLGLTKTYDNRRFDFFSGRVIFPIHSVSGKVLGFGGRTLQTDKKVAKYFNSPESPLYDKSSVLYGLFFSKKEIVKQDRCFLVEGYTDVISLFQSGVENVVSSSGTALTKGQIKLIRRYTQNITVLYDSDVAGIKASFRGIDLLLEEGMNVKVLLFPEGEDPDSFSKRVSTSELKTYINDNQKDFVEFKTEILLKEADGDPVLRAGLIKEILRSISLIPDAILRSVYIKNAAVQFEEITEATLINELNKIRRKNQANIGEFKSTYREEATESEVVDNKLAEQLAEQKPVEVNFYEQEFDLIRILILYGDRAIELKQNDIEETPFEISVAELIIMELERDYLSFQNPVFQEIYEINKKMLLKGEFCHINNYLRNENIEIVKFATDVLSYRYELSENWLNKYNISTVEEIHKISQAVKESLYSFKNVMIMRDIKAIQEQLKNKIVSEEKTSELLKQQRTLEKVRGVFLEKLNRIIV